jgi:undecaprenyl-diphosphatase
MITFDQNLFLWINGLAGKFSPADWLLRGIANDYLVIVSASLVLLVLWLWGSQTSQRENNQKAVVVAALSLGISQGFLNLSNLFYFRPRPFNELDANVIFYQPTDSSFPSNSAAIVFAIAFAVLLFNRRVGIYLLILACLHGFSRIYVGIHYPLDIVGGAAFGGFTALLSYGMVWLLAPLLAYLLALARKLYLA